MELEDLDSRKWQLVAETEARIAHELIAETLRNCGGNQTRAASMLGISRRTLINRLNEYNLPRPRKASG